MVVVTGSSPVAPTKNPEKILLWRLSTLSAKCSNPHIAY